MAKTDVMPDGTPIPELRTALESVATTTMKGGVPQGWKLCGVSFNRDYDYDSDYEYDVEDGMVPAGGKKERPEYVHMKFESNGVVAGGQSITFVADVRKGSAKVTNIRLGDDDEGMYF